MNKNSKLTKLFSSELKCNVLDLEPKHLDIVQYSNRKLYNRNTSKYITLIEIESKVKQGYTIEAKANQTEENITQLVLAKCLVNCSKLNVDKLIKLIKGETNV